MRVLVMDDCRGMTGPREVVEFFDRLMLFVAFVFDPFVLFPSPVLPPELRPERRVLTPDEDDTLVGWRCAAAAVEPLP